MKVPKYKQTKYSNIYKRLYAMIKCHLSYESKVGLVPENRCSTPSKCKKNDKTSRRKHKTTDTCCNMDEFLKYYAK